MHGNIYLYMVFFCFNKYLVGGFNPFEKILVTSHNGSKWIISPGRDEHKK